MLRDRLLNNESAIALKAASRREVTLKEYRVLFVLLYHVREITYIYCRDGDLSRLLPCRRRFIASVALTEPYWKVSTRVMVFLLLLGICGK